MGSSEVIANLDYAASILDEYFPEVKYQFYNTGEYSLTLGEHYIEGMLPNNEGDYAPHLRKECILLYGYEIMERHHEVFRRLKD